MGETPMFSDAFETKVRHPGPKGKGRPLYRIAVTSQTGTETVQADMPGWNPVTGERLDISPADMKGHLNELLSVLDERRAETQKRMVAAYGLVKYLPIEYQQMVLEIIDCLCGKADPSYTVQRWDAVAEENRDLAHARHQHYAANDTDTCSVCHETKGYHVSGCPYEVKS